MIRAGIAGFGLAGRVFHAPLVSSVEGFELAGVLERQTNLAAERYPGIVTYRTFGELLADSSLSLVILATPSGTHYDLARQALEAGRNLVVDKPVAAQSEEIASLAALARRKGLLLAPFHNRRWDGDFLTLQALLREGTLGRLVHLESRMDRWNPGAPRRPWKNDPAQGGGVLLDLGTHLVDQALVLFDKPHAVGAEVLRERDGDGANDAFTLRLRYDRFLVTLGANALSSPAGARFHARGTRGNYRKKGVDPQEAALGKLTRIPAADWGREPEHNWGMLHVDVDGGMVTRPVSTLPGDYRRYYEGIRNALTGNAPPPVTPAEAWRVARILEWARQSSGERREIDCDWTGEPE